MANPIQPQPGGRFTGHGPEWRDSKLSAEDARTATAWVELKIDKRSMLTTKQHVDAIDDAVKRKEAELLEV